MKHIENLSGESLQVHINKMICKHSYNFEINTLILGANII